MPVYNSQKYLKESIESILNQTYRNFEFIIVNDGSTDKSEEIIKEYAFKDSRIIFINNKQNQGIAVARNTGISSSCGDLIANMDADDISLPHRLERQLKFIQDNSTCDICIGDMEVVDASGGHLYFRIYPKESVSIKNRFLRYNTIPNPCVLYKKTVWAGNFGYDPSCSYGTDDYDFWFKAIKHYNASSVGEVIHKYRLHDLSTIHKKFDLVEKEVLRIRVKNIKAGYRPSVLDLIFNFVEFLALYIVPAKARLAVYEIMRAKRLL